MNEGTKRRSRLRGSLISALALLALGVGTVAIQNRGTEAGNAPTEPAQLPARGEDVAGAAPAVEALESVVAVEVEGRGITGTGFRVAVARIVVTSAHAVGNAVRVSVLLRDGSRRTARVLGRTPELDIAALELEDDTGLPPMHSGSGLSELRVGDPVHALGPRSGVTSGTVTSLRRRIRLLNGASLDALETDLRLDASGGGGPLVNSHGEVVGVNTDSASRRGRGSTGAGFAIPVDVAKREVLAIVADA